MWVFILKGCLPCTTHILFWFLSKFWSRLRAVCNMIDVIVYIQYPTEMLRANFWASLCFLVLWHVCTHTHTVGVKPCVWLPSLGLHNSLGWECLVGEEYLGDLPHFCLRSLLLRVVLCQVFPMLTVAWESARSGARPVVWLWDGRRRWCLFPALSGGLYVPLPASWK